MNEWLGPEHLEKDVNPERAVTRALGSSELVSTSGLFPAVAGTCSSDSTQGDGGHPL